MPLHPIRPQLVLETGKRLTCESAPVAASSGKMSKTLVSSAPTPYSLDKSSTLASLLAIITHPIHSRDSNSDAEVRGHQGADANHQTIASPTSKVDSQ